MQVYSYRSGYYLWQAVLSGAVAVYLLVFGAIGKDWSLILPGVITLGMAAVTGLRAIQTRPALVVSQDGVTIGGFLFDSKFAWNDIECIILAKQSPLFVMGMPIGGISIVFALKGRGLRRDSPGVPLAGLDLTEGGGPRLLEMLNHDLLQAQQGALPNLVPDRPLAPAST